MEKVIKKNPIKEFGLNNDFEYLKKNDFKKGREGHHVKGP
jgi:hypothetical protein